MGDFLTIRPDLPTEGSPITVEILVPVIPARDQLIVIGNDGTFTVPLTFKNQHTVAEFSLYKAGTYVLSLNGNDKSITVSPRNDVPFHIEFGLLSAFVLFTLGGLILWTRKRHRKGVAGGFSPSG